MCRARGSSHMPWYRLLLDQRIVAQRKLPYDAELCAAAVEGAQVDAELFGCPYLVAVMLSQGVQNAFPLRSGQRLFQRFMRAGALFLLVSV